MKHHDVCSMDSTSSYTLVCIIIYYTMDILCIRWITSGLLVCILRAYELRAYHIYYGLRLVAPMHFLLYMMVLCVLLVVGLKQSTLCILLLARVATKVLVLLYTVSNADSLLLSRPQFAFFPRHNACTRSGIRRTVPPKPLDRTRPPSATAMGFLRRKRSEGGASASSGASGDRAPAGAGAGPGGSLGSGGGSLGSQGSGGGTATFRVTVPERVAAGDEFQVYAGTRTVKVRCPPNVEPGQSLQITVPVGPAQGMPRGIGTAASTAAPAPASRSAGAGGGRDSPNVRRMEGSENAYMVEVPPGARGGEQFPVTVAGQQLMVTCPPSARPGMSVRIIPPPPAAPSQDVAPAHGGGLGGRATNGGGGGGFGFGFGFGFGGGGGAPPRQRQRQRHWHWRQGRGHARGRGRTAAPRPT